MASYKYPAYLSRSDDAAFDGEHRLGSPTPFSRIYRCLGCGGRTCRRTPTLCPRRITTSTRRPRVPSAGVSPCGRITTLNETSAPVRYPALPGVERDRGGVTTAARSGRPPGSGDFCWTCHRRRLAWPFSARDIWRRFWSWPPPARMLPRHRRDKPHSPQAGHARQGGVRVLQAGRGRRLRQPLAGDDVVGDRHGQPRAP